MLNETLLVPDAMPQLRQVHMSQQAFAQTQTELVNVLSENQQLKDQLKDKVTLQIENSRLRSLDSTYHRNMGQFEQLACRHHPDRMVDCFFTVDTLHSTTTSG